MTSQAILGEGLRIATQTKSNVSNNESIRHNDRNSL